MLEKYVGRSSFDQNKSFLTKMNPLTIFFMDLDHKLQDLFLVSHRDFFIQSAFLGLHLISLSICNKLGINILEQYFYTQQ